MAAFSSAPWLAPMGFTAAQLQELQERAGALFPQAANPLQALAKMGTWFPLDLDVRAAVSSATVDGGVHVAQFAFKAVAVQASCETSGGSAATLDLRKALAADTGTYATMLTAAIDVHTTVGIGTAGTILAGSEDFAVGDRVRARAIATGGAVVGSRVTLWCVRL